MLSLDLNVVYVEVRLRNGERVATKYAISDLEFEDLCYVPPEPPPFDLGSLIKYQEKLAKSNKTAEVMGLHIARVLKEGFQKRVWEKK